ncbi:hypothetical protein AN218_17330 [Streptomyces nanshensis]|uniref:Uncharacterized protein n=1 Tax=Streptomyces nanshensis TaxID=518642 RepID=A0A1E7L2W7_9ACTN|nr:hypothetical protein AN218_17330 [Streptomyces nanshensis]
MNQYGGVRVEVDSKQPSDDSWRPLLAALELADRFGAHSNSSGFSTAWALVCAETFGRADRSTGHQP